MDRMEARMDRSDKILDDLSRFARRSLDEIYRLSEASVAISNVNDHKIDEVDKNLPELMYNGVNLYGLGVSTPVEKAFNIILEVWSADERREIVIQPKKTLSNTGRIAADEERTELFEKAMRFALGDQFSKRVFSNVLRLVNQRMHEKRLK